MVIESTQGINSLDFYNLLQAKGTLDRIKGARIELSLWDQESFQPIIERESEGVREISPEKSAGNPEALG